MRLEQHTHVDGNIIGSLKLHDDLLDQGATCSENRVACLASLAGIEHRLAANAVLAVMVAN